jgi:hypothetical protein
MYIKRKETAPGQLLQLGFGQPGFHLLHMNTGVDLGFRNHKERILKVDVKY